MLLFIRRVLVIAILLFLTVVLFRMFAPSKYQQVKNYLTGNKTEIIDTLQDTRDGNTKTVENTVDTITSDTDKTHEKEDISPKNNVSDKNNNEVNMGEIDVKKELNREKTEKIIDQINAILDKDQDISIEKLEVTARPETKEKLDITASDEVTYPAEQNIQKNGEEKVNIDIANTDEGKTLEEVKDKESIESIDIKKDESMKTEKKVTHANSEPVRIYINNSSQNYTNITQQEVSTTPSYSTITTKNQKTTTNNELSEYDRAMIEHIFGTISE